MLCDICLELLREAERKIFSSTADPYQYPGHYVLMQHSTRSTERYQLAVQQGCKFCVVPWRIAGPEIPPQFFATITRQPDPEKRTPYLKHGMSVQLESAITDYFVAQWELEENHSCSHKSRVQGFTEEVTTTADPHSLESVQASFDNCLRNHDLCKSRTMRPPPYPERLIDIGFQEGMIRVVDTASTQVQGSYMTLSHRWGTNQNKLEDSSAEDLYKGVPISSLSRTYQDTIAQAKRLGVRYLWIDSLCIYQDNRLDIRNAASSMAEVYSHSMCNISALTARQDGLFSPRSPTSIDRRSFEICERQSGLACCYLIHDMNTWSSEVVKTPLAIRGWVAQEMMLAPRTIYFGEQQLFWHCMSQSTHETDFKHLKEQIQWDNGPVYARAGTPFLIHSVLADLGIQSRDKLLSTWRFFIEYYCALNLTFTSDKLLAIAGIAKKFSEGLEDEYCAGLWKSTLPESLCWWRSVKVLDPPGRIEPYQCPTWSWGSLKGESTFRLPGAGLKKVSRLIDVSVQTHNDDPFGMVTSATLSLRALLIPLTVVSKPHQPAPTAMFRGTMRSPPNGHEFEAYVSLDVEMEFPADVYFALISTDTREDKKYNQADGTSTTRLWIGADGLLLRRVGRPCTFERVGNLQQYGSVEEFSRWMPSGFMDFFSRRTLDDEPNNSRIDDSDTLADITLI